MDTCKNCKFFARERLHMKLGACRAHVPTVVILPQGPTGVWPPVSEDHWCGEYKPSKVVEYADA